MSDREALAKIIDPEAWRDVHPHSTAFYDDEEAQATYESFFWKGVHERREPSLTAADAALAWMAARPDLGLGRADERYLVTIKLAKNPAHDPRNKVTAPCHTSGLCTDATGEHHTMLVRSAEEVEELRRNEVHITRVETVPASESIAALASEEERVPSAYRALIGRVGSMLDRVPDSDAVMIDKADLRALVSAVSHRGSAGAVALRDAADAWGADPHAVGDTDRDARNWLRDRADDMDALDVEAPVV